MNPHDSDSENSTAGGSPVPNEEPGSGWYAFLFGPPFKLIGFLYRTYHANRDRAAGLTSKPGVSATLKKVAVLTLVLWIAIWLLASEESRNRLTEAVRQNFPSIGTTFD